jgi:hypothetical protein
MGRRRVAKAAIILFIAAIGFAACQQATTTPVVADTSSADSPSTPVLVELFTSEGCSSCPPADALLAHLEDSQPVQGAVIIPLKQHVDYWNWIGWTDRFSSPQFSQRQADYARVLGNENVYTPQMVVDGQEEFVGSDDLAAREAIARARRSVKAPIALRVSAAAGSGSEITLAIKISELPDIKEGDPVDLWVAVTESSLASQVTRGENTGRRLAHTAVVRELRRADRLNTAGSFATELGLPLAPEWKRENLSAVVFLQQQGSRRVLGAARLPLFLPESSQE